MLGFLRRRRFRDVVQRQLDLFDDEFGGIVRDARAARTAYAKASDEHDAVATNAHFDELAEEIEDALMGMRDRLASTMDPGPSRWYRSEFLRQAMARYGDVVPYLKRRDRDFEVRPGEEAPPYNPRYDDR